MEKEELVNLFKSNNINIFDGRWLINYIAYEIINYIIEENKIKKEETEISILVNYLDDTSIENIKLLAKEFKRINIVTNHINKLKKIEQDIYDEFGIMLTITNNKKKSLKNARIILNIDFPKETINKYNIFDEAIIVNLDGDVKIDKKRFSGININDYEIKSSFVFNNKFYAKDIYESKIYKKTTFINIREEIKKSGLKIKELVGNNGIIKFN